MPYIYKIENLINGKVYIGKTLYEIDRRWRQHIQNSKKDNFRHMPLYNAMTKYGINNFSITEVEYVDNIDQLSDREKYWVEQYDSYFSGYNATRGGDGSLLYDYDIVWDCWTQGYSIKEISKIVGCNDFVVRTVLDLHKISTQERKQRSENAQLQSHKPYMRRVNKINPNTLEVIQTYNSVSEAALSVPCDSSYLAKCCKKCSSAFGYLWNYADNNYVSKDYSSKPVLQIDIVTGEILNRYNSVSEAAKSVNGDSSYISKVCRGIQHTSKGYKWTFEN